MMRPSSIVCLLGALGALLLPVNLPAVNVNTLQSQIDAILARSAVSGNTWGVLIQNQSGNITYYSRNPANPMRPASNTKMFTSAAAFGLLGTSHVYSGMTIQNYCSAMNKASDNTMADNLLIHIGSVISGSATYAAGAEDVLQWCSGTAGINMAGARMDDGSGLDYDNRFSAAQCVQLMRYMLTAFPTYDDTFPIGCVDGTLADRFCGTAGSGNVYAKTGTLVNGQTIALSGYLYNQNDGKRYLFSFLANNVANIDATRQAIDDAVVVMGQAAIPNDLANGTVVDNGYSTYSEVGSWGASASAGYYGGGSRYSDAGTGADKAVFTPNLSAAGQYNVYAWWVQGSNRATNAVYQVTHASGTTNVSVNQSVNGGQWNYLGAFTFNAGTSGKVTLADNVTAGKVVSADAVCFVYTGAAEIIVDNVAPNFTASSNWFASTSQPGYYGANYHARATASVSDAAVWKATLPTSGSYKVYARWTTGSNRATAAPFVILHASGSTTVNVNQQQNNGVWVLLGTFNMNAGTADRVKLSCWTTAGYYVIADAVKFVKQ